VADLLFIALPNQSLNKLSF